MKTHKVAASAALLFCCLGARSATVQPEDPKVTKALAGKVAGEPRDCLWLRDTQSSSTFNGTILYRVNGKLTYRNDANSCSALSDNVIIVTRIYSSQVCRGEILQLLDRTSHFPVGSCSYGQFVPYTPAS